MRFAFFRVLALLLASLALSGGGPVLADSPTEQQIIDALRGGGGCRVRCVRPRPFEKAEETRRIIDLVRNKATRALTVEGRTQLQDDVRERPRIDLEIPFEFNSATPTKAGLDLVAVLARALQLPQIKDDIVLLIGHTDARGTDAYNVPLSERRAETVKRILIEQFNIPAQRLLAIGLGKQFLKKPDDPLALENRRLQVVNLGTQ